MNSQEFSHPWEDAIRAAVRVRNADSGFALRLRADLMRKPAAAIPVRRRPALRPAWIAVTVAITFLLGALVLIGPERVVAALQHLLGYLPDAGFVRMDQPFRILEGQIKEERDGAVLYIRQVLADDRRTVVVYEMDCPGPETQWLKTMTYCTDAPALLLPGGARSAAAGLSGRSGLPYYRERAEFPALASDVTRVMLVLPFRSAPGEPAAPWTVDLPLIRTLRAVTVYPVVEVTPSAPPSGTADPLAAGINFSLERVVAMEENYLLEGSLEWDPARYQSVAMDYTMLEIEDGAGRLCPWEFAAPDSPIGGAKHRVPWAVRFNPRGRPGPFLMRVKSIITEKPASASFEMDFGPTPHIGQTWGLDIPLRAGDYDLRVTSAWIRGDAGSIVVVFSFAGEGNAIAAAWEDADQKTTSIAGGGLEGLSIFESGAAYEHMPVGRHTIRAVSVRLQIPGSWIIPLEGIPSG
jgi:hypothetical protein